MTTSVSYVHVQKSLYSLAIGDASDANPLIICSALPITYGINQWSAATNAIDINKCFLCSWDGANFVKLLALTDAEKEMQGSFLDLLVNATKSDEIQGFLNTSPAYVALGYSAGASGAVGATTVFAYIEVSKFKSN